MRRGRFSLRLAGAGLAAPWLDSNLPGVFLMMSGRSGPKQISGATPLDEPEKPKP